MFVIATALLANFLFRTPKEKAVSPQAATTTNTYVLVHSAWLGAWQWQAVSPLIKAAGHRVITPDLPGHGSDKTPASQITMAHYVEALLAILDKEEKPVILVGHSFNAITVSRVAELRPNKVKHLVFLAGVLPTEGASFLDMAQQLEGSVAVANFYFSKDGTQAFVKQAAIKEAFMHDISEADYARIAPKIVPEPAAPLHYVLELSQENYGRVTKHYIQCQQDKTLPTKNQWQMYFAKVNTARGLNSSHTPNFSKPKQLAEILLSYK